MNTAELFDRLDRVVRLLQESWIKDVYPLQVSIAEYDRIAEPLQRYTGSRLIQMWYVDHLLIGCRRLVDDGEDVISIKRALVELRWIAHCLTPQRLAEYRQHCGVYGDAGSVNAVQNDIDRELGVPTGDPIGKQHVQPDLDAINDMAYQLKAIVSHGIAHRLDIPRPNGVARGEIDTFLVNLQAMYVRWSIVLRATDVFARPEGEHVLTPVVRALELFDWETYIEAQSEAMKQQAASGAMNWGELDARARIEYRFD